MLTIPKGYSFKLSVVFVNHQYQISINHVTQEYILSCLHKHHGMELSLFCSLLLDSGGEVEEAMSQADRIAEMKKLHDKWCRVQDALKAMSKCINQILY